MVLTVTTEPHSMGNSSPDMQEAPNHHISGIEILFGGILRFGVIISVAVMFLGLAISFSHHPPTLHEMISRHFQAQPLQIWQGLKEGHGIDIVELGILLLVLTPIARVAISAIYFAFYDHDRMFILITLGVLILTLISLLFLN